MEALEPPSGLDIARCVATARVTMPQSVVRLSAGRMKFTIADQVGLQSALCPARAQYFATNTLPITGWWLLD